MHYRHGKMCVLWEMNTWLSGLSYYGLWWKCTILPGNGKLTIINPLCMKYNIMRLASNNEIKMAAHGRNLAYYVTFLLYDHFLRTNDEDVECSL